MSMFFETMKNRCLSFFTTICTILAFVDMFWSISSLYPDTTSKVVLIVLIVLISVMLSYVSIWLCGVKTIKCGNKRLIIRYGNLLKIKSPIKAFAVNRCFDTLVDDKVISKESLHGQWVLRNYENRIARLNELIHSSLYEQNERPEKVLSRKEKPKGNLERYRVGAIVSICCSPKEEYYLLGLTEMNANLNTHCSSDDYVSAMQNLFNYYSIHGQGKDIAISLIGSGAMSRLGKDKQDMLAIMVSLLKLYSDSLTGDVTIVLSKRDRNRIVVDSIH